MSGLWSTSGDWYPVGIPGSGSSGDTVTIGASGAAYTVTYDYVPQYSLSQLLINSSYATLSFASNETLTVTGQTSVRAGTLDLEAAGDVFNTGSLYSSSGSLIMLGAGDVVGYSAATIGGVVNITGTTSFGTSGNNIALSGTIEVTGGTGTVNFSGLNNSTSGGWFYANGATMVIAGSLANAAVHNVLSDSSSSIFRLTGSLYYGSSIIVNFQGTHGEFEYQNTQDDHITFNVSGLNAGGSTITPTNFIHLTDSSSITIASGGTGTSAAGSVILSNGDTLSLSGITGYGALGWKAVAKADASGGTDIFLAVICYAAGTHIRTQDGDKRVEDIAEGDLVIAVAGGAPAVRPVRWVGRRRIDLTAHPRPDAVAPIRIARGAVAENVPARDLFVSPDHAIHLDGKLICARQLVNGSTIRQEQGWTSVEYFHIELDSHDILLAEGLAAESYLDTGNRGFFINGDAPLVLHPTLLSEADVPTREARSCAPFVWQDADVRPVWARLAARAAELGAPVAELETTTEPALIVMANGKVLRRMATVEGRHQFVLPAGVNEVRVVSRAAAPNDIHPWTEDRRRLGVYVERVVLRGHNHVQEVPLDHPTLHQGWWAVERDGQELRRWTSGDAVLPLPVMQGPVVLEIAATSSGMSYPVDVGPACRAA
ncbi:Hint domain-containing protein [Rhodopila sp.]|uniref:Hint domain-containing protein n=1 Tax=Rhodopila sp. TaxID=2480087 RepID=UPI002BCBB1A0|nr:Hint domain-containing protein [Rhodopila sp.]HVZ06521.1 Hint domain-containing protein [Rhodopila sp.]